MSEAPEVKNSVPGSQSPADNAVLDEAVWQKWVNKNKERAAARRRRLIRIFGPVSRDSVYSKALRPRCDKGPSLITTLRRARLSYARHLGVQTTDLRQKVRQRFVRLCSVYRFV